MVASFKTRYSECAQLPEQPGTVTPFTVVGMQDPTGVPAVVPIEPATDVVAETVEEPAETSVGAAIKVAIKAIRILFMVSVPEKVEGIAEINPDSAAG